MGLQVNALVGAGGTRNNNYVGTPEEGEYSPVKPEILQACDLSVAAMIQPRAKTSHQ